jgi:hypothetical protein
MNGIRQAGQAIPPGSWSALPAIDQISFRHTAAVQRVGAITEHTGGRQFQFLEPFPLHRLDREAPSAGIARRQLDYRSWTDCGH